MSSIYNYELYSSKFEEIITPENSDDESDNESDNEKGIYLEFMGSKYLLKEKDTLTIKSLKISEDEEISIKDSSSETINSATSRPILNKFHGSGEEFFLNLVEDERFDEWKVDIKIFYRDGWKISRITRTIPAFLKYRYIEEQTLVCRDNNYDLMKTHDYVEIRLTAPKKLSHVKDYLHLYTIRINLKQ
jgi:hypothetical protein